MMAFYIWGNKPTWLGVTSIFVVLGGSLLYTFVKMNENKKPLPKVAPSPAPAAKEPDVEMQQSALRQR
jgi:hypothetical protein